MSALIQRLTTRTSAQYYSGLVHARDYAVVIQSNNGDWTALNDGQLIILVDLTEDFLRGLHDGGCVVRRQNERRAA